MSYKNKISILVKALLLSFVLVGCVHNVPLAVDPARDMSQALPKTKKIPVKVGMYLSTDLKKYVYRQQKMGMTFQMNVGEYLPPISMQMAAAMFEDVVSVDSPPPYNEGYKPDVEAVVVPEILYCYGNAVGTLSGYIEGKAKIRITAYDLGGKILWQDEAMGESRSRELSFVGAFLGGMEEVGKTGYQAAFAAAVTIINDFNARPPKELYSLLEIKSVATLKNRRNISDFEIFRNYYEKGQFQYERKNYYQALYSFEKAETLNPEDLSTLFYIGVCYTHTGAKDKAIEKFRRVVELGPKSQEAVDSRKWIDLLSEPLRIVIVNSPSFEENGLDAAVIGQSLGDSHMYELLDIGEHRPLAKSTPQKEWNQFLERCYKRGAKVVIFNDIDYTFKKIMIDQQSIGDLATEHSLTISSKVYSAKKKELKADIKIAEKTITIREKTKEEKEIIREQLLENGAEKLVLRLLENNIY